MVSQHLQLQVLGPRREGERGAYRAAMLALRYKELRHLTSHWPAACIPWCEVSMYSVTQNMCSARESSDKCVSVPAVLHTQWTPKDSEWELRVWEQRAIDQITKTKVIWQALPDSSRETHSKNPGRVCKQFLMNKRKTKDPGSRAGYQAEGTVPGEKGAG